MTMYNMEIARNLRVHSMSHSDRVEISLKTNSKEVLDYFDKVLNDLLSDEHYLDYLIKEDVGE